MQAASAIVADGSVQNLMFCDVFLFLESVANAFMLLLEGGQSGQVMAVWSNAPPYYIPGAFNSNLVNL